MTSKIKYSTLSNIAYAINIVHTHNKIVIFIMLIMIISQVALPTLGIFIPKLIIEEVSSATSLKSIIWLILGLSTTLMILTITEQISNRYMVTKQMEIGAIYINAIDEKALNTDFENIASKEGQSALTKAHRTTGNDTAATRVILPEVISIIKNILGLLASSTILAFVNPMIIVLLIITSIIKFTVGRWENNYIYKFKEDESKNYKKFLYLKENAYDVNAAKDIRIYKMSQWILAKFTSNIEESNRINIKKSRGSMISALLNVLLTVFKDSIAYSYLIYLVLNGLSISDFVLYIGAIIGFSTWLDSLANDMVKINKTSLDFSDFRSYIDMKERTNRDIGKLLPQANQQPCSITFKNISYSYGNSTDKIFHNFDLHIEKNKKLAIVGLNGAGKTTLIKLLTGLFKPQKGTILINGTDHNDYNIDDYYSLYSVSFQDAVIMAFTIKENITMKSNNTETTKLKSAIINSDLYNKVQSLPNGTDSYIYKIMDKSGIELSGGEKQKLFLARALFKDAPFLILDEPTATLDAIAESNLYKRYDEITKGKTSIYISHRLASTQFCDEIIILENGKIIEQGSHKHLMKLDGKYANMYGIQSHYYKEEM